MSTVISAVAISAIAAAVWLSQPREAATTVDSKRYNVAGAPEQAAACVARNADGQTPVMTSTVQPLYGTEHVAVLMRDSPTGDTLATVYIEPASQGSYAKVVPTPLVIDRDALVKRLLAKC
jgi:hypothetical protein